MYEDAWYNAFVPKSHTQSDRSKHRRRESLLKQPNEGNQADVAPVESIAEIIEDVEQSRDPPKATVARRAKSYSDFYDVVQAHVKKERGLEKQKRKSREQIRTELDFAQWYGAVSDELLDASHEEFQLYLEQLQLSQSHLDGLIANTTASLAILSSLSESFQAVDAQTTAFRSQCEDLVADQRRAEKLADELAENIQFYTYLEPTSRRLNAPGAGNHVRRKEFAEMLVNLDNCLSYMQSHPNHKESATYGSRYRLLMTRALTLIRVHFTNSLREIAADVSKRIADRQLNDTTMSALLYAKFRVGATELKQLGREINSRAVLPKNAEPGAEAEYQSLVNELHQSYAATRGRLILPIVTKKMSEIAMAPSTSKDLVTFARSSISFIRGICFDEYELWGEWFDGYSGLYEFLHAVCDPLYDHLRPRIIHETKLLKLCELCTLIQTRYFEEEEEEEEEEDSEAEGPRLEFTKLIRPALEDAQTRLVFLALAVLRDDIERFKPKPDDLNYPARNKATPATPGAKPSQPVLSGKKSTNGPLTPLPMAPMVVEDDEGMELRWQFNTESAFADWYPTLRKAIWLLSKIYRLINSTVFDDLAHQIVHQTTLSLQHASSEISKRSSPTDAHLFLIKHLLILKQQIVAFDIEFVTPEISFDFSNLTATFWELRERGGLFNPRNLVRLVGGTLIPRVVENMLDAKAELDGRLRTVINDFTSSFANRITAPIAESAGGKKSFDANVATRAVRENTEKEVPFLRKKLEEYIDDLRTRETLVAAVQDQSIGIYENWYDRHAEQMRAKGEWTSKKGKGREDGVWDPDVFADWSEGIFKVGRLAMGQGPDEDDQGSDGSDNSNDNDNDDDDDDDDDTESQ